MKSFLKKVVITGTAMIGFTILVSNDEVSADETQNFSEKVFIENTFHPSSSIRVRIERDYSLDVYNNDPNLPDYNPIPRSFLHHEVRNGRQYRAIMQLDEYYRGREYYHAVYIGYLSDTGVQPINIPILE